MTSLEEIRQMAEKLAKKELGILADYFPQIDQPIALEGFKNLHRRLMVEKNVDPKKYEEMFRKAVQWAGEDLESLLKENNSRLPPEKKMEFLGNKITEYIEEQITTEK